MVATADLDLSEWESYDGDTKKDVFFDKLVLDEGKCRGLSMFRLAESLSTVVVHKNVRDHLFLSGIDTMSFVPV